MILPNHLSIARILLTPVFYLLFISENPVLRQFSLLVFVLAALTDWYDGSLARRRNEISRLGKFLDPLADKILTGAAFLAFAALEYVPWWMVWLIVGRDLTITLLRSVAEYQNAPIVTSRSAKVKTFTQMAVLYYLLLLVIGKEVGWVRDSFQETVTMLLDVDLVSYLMVMVTLLTVATGVQYLIDNRTFVQGLFRPRRHVAS